MAGKRKHHPTAEDEESEEDGLVPFEITYLNSGQTGMIQKSPFQTTTQPEGALDFTYMIHPKAQWDSMQRYNNFIIAGETFSRGEFVWVTADLKEFRVDPVHSDLPKFWVGKILEVRAKDRSNVFAKIAWIYWPQELPKVRDQGVTATGRRSYHGKHELIASNSISIQDVTTFSGKANVEQWVEDDEEDDDKRFYYWRQTFDIRNSRLSDLKRICVCRQYQNPDHKLYGCSAESCKLWLHEDCLIDDILTKTYSRLVIGRDATKDMKDEKIENGNHEKEHATKDDIQDTIKNELVKQETVKKGPQNSAIKTSSANLGTPKMGRGKGKGAAAHQPTPYAGLFSAKLVFDSDETTRVEIEDLRKDAKLTSWTEKVNCPHCHNVIE